jgi:hypothetical protein
MSVNLHETIQAINTTNDNAHNLGDGNKVVKRQEKNGVDLLLNSQSLNYFIYENFQKLFPSNYVDEMKEYNGALNEREREHVLKKYGNEMHEINQPIQNRPSKFLNTSVNKIAPVVNYEVMYGDKVCTFFIGSISVIGLYIVYKMIERD